MLSSFVRLNNHFSLPSILSLISFAGLAARCCDLLVRCVERPTHNFWLAMLTSNSGTATADGCAGSVKGFDMVLWPRGQGDRDTKDVFYHVLRLNIPSQHATR